LVYFEDAKRSPPVLDSNCKNTRPRKKKEKEEDSNEKAKSKVERTVCYKI
jgi:hypothetical protein